VRVPSSKFTSLSLVLSFSKPHNSFLSLATRFTNCLQRIQMENEPRRTAKPTFALTGPQDSRRLRLLEFPDNRHMKVLRFVSPTHRPSLPPGRISGTHFCWRLSRPQGRSATGRIKSLETFSDPIGSRTRDLPAFSAVPQPTAPPRTSLHLRMLYIYIYIYIYIHTHTHTYTHTHTHKVVQIWPGLSVCKEDTVYPGHIWTTLCIYCVCE
jgi:hypothetical protein